MGEYLSSVLDVTIPFTETDIGGTDTTGADTTVQWVSMVDFESVMYLVELGTWDSSDDLDVCKLQQATSSAGAGVKDLTTAAASGNYDTSAPIDADGNWVILEAHASDLDVSGGFKYVRLFASEADNTGADNISAVCIRGNPRVAKNELKGAAVASSNVYVKPS